MISAGEYQGTSGAEMLNCDYGARQNSLGNALVASGDDVNTLFYNPGGLGQFHTMNLCLSHVHLFSELSMQSLAFNYPFWLGSFGVGFNYLHSGGFNEIVDGLETSQEIYLSSLLFTAGYGAKLYNMFYPGITVKYLSSDIAENRAQAIAVDAGLIVGFETAKFYNKIEQNLKIGLSVHNIGTRIKYIEQEEDLPQKVCLGIWYKPFSYTAVSIQTDYWLKYALKDSLLYKAGFEFLPDYFITPRMGLNIDKDRIEYTFGLGVGSVYDKYRYRFDIGYKGNQDLGSNYYISLQLGELFFSQYREQHRVSVSGFPRIYPGILGEKEFKTEPSDFINNDKINIRLNFLKKQFHDENQMIQNHFKEEITDSDKFKLVSTDEDLLINTAIIRSKSGNKLHFILKQEQNVIKEYRVRFSTKKTFSKIVKVLMKKIKEDVYPQLFAELSLSSEQEEAEVYLNNIRIGSTPLDIDKIKTGKYTVKIRKQGYQQTTQNIEIDSEKENSYTFDLLLKKEAVKIPAVYSVNIIDNQKDDIGSAFHFLLEEYIIDADNYFTLDSDEDHLQVQYSFNKRKKIYIGEVELFDSLRNKMIKKMKLNIKNDNQIPQMIENLVASLKRYVDQFQKRKSRKDSTMHISSWKKDYTYYIDKQVIKLPYSASVESGEYQLLVYDNKELLLEQWLNIDPGQSYYINPFFNYIEKFANKLNKNFWDMNKISKFNNSHVLVQDSSMILKTKNRDMKSQVVLVSYPFELAAFEQEIHIKLNSLTSSQLYWGFSDDLGGNYYILLNSKGYSALSFHNDKTITADTITFKDYNNQYIHKLKLVYDGFSLLYYADDLLIKEIPVTLGNKSRIGLVADSNDQMMFNIRKLSLIKTKISL